MNFQDEEIEKVDLNDVDLNNVDNISQMIVKFLCGEKYYKKSLEPEEKDLLLNLLTTARSRGLNYAQFNELLLLLDQDRVTEAFFKFFFDKEIINLEELKQGIIKFRGYAMLCFGNFRFAYKQLIQKNEKELEEALEPYCKSTDEVIKKFKDRRPKALEIETIDKDKTWYTGYISKKNYLKYSCKKQLTNNKK